MAWLKLDDGFASHPKVAALSDRDFRIWVRTLLYCARYRTQGHVPKGATLEVPGLTDSQRNRFESEGLLDVRESEDWIHDWEAYNPKDPTAADRMERLRQRQREQSERNERRNAERNSTVTSDVTPAVTEPSLDRNPRAPANARVPVPSPKPKEKTHPPTDVVQYEAGGRVANEIEPDNTIEPLDATSLFEDIQRKLAAKEQT